MSSSKERIYKDVPLKDWTFMPEDELFIYECPCGDIFMITVGEFASGKRITECPSCSLKVRMVAEEDEIHISNTVLPEAVSGTLVEVEDRRHEA